MSLPMRKVETMRPVAAIVDEIVEVATFDSDAPTTGGVRAPLSRCLAAGYRLGPWDQDE